MLFCDVVGSTALGESLDAEALRALLARYFERMKSIVERHGGVVEKFIGDAVMAVFGLPAVHEDDAVRALRAAAEMQLALPELGIEGRIGVCSGEVVTGTEERLATGDAVNVAARLQQAAQPGETLLGETTLRLARRRGRGRARRASELKGKREPVPAWRLVAVSTAAAERRFDSLLVGRERELRALGEAWERVRGGPGCELVTVVGAAGVGKSRLVAEFLAGADATVVRGRCLSYGEGITYWPVVEVVKQLEAQRSRLELDPAAAEALAALLGQTARRRRTRSRGRSASCSRRWRPRRRLSPSSTTSSGARTSSSISSSTSRSCRRALRSFLSAWRDRSCSTGGAGGRASLRLQPLEPDEAEALMDARIGARELGTDIRERILRAAGGNPLFVEEMAAMVQASGDGDGRGAADAPGADRGTARPARAAGAVRARARRRRRRGVPPRRRPGAHARGAAAYDPADLARPQGADPPGPAGVRGRGRVSLPPSAHARRGLRGLPKAVRAELHEQFADWLEEHGAELVELDELVGYHLEQAYRYRQELGHVDERTQALAARAGERLEAAGSRAIARQDFRAWLALLERAAELLPDERRDARFEIELGWARFFTGQGAEAVLSGLAEAAERAAAAGNRVAELGLRLDHACYESCSSRRRGLRSDSASSPRRRCRCSRRPATSGGSRSPAARSSSPRRSRARAPTSPSAAERVVEHARRADYHLMVDWGERMLVHALYSGATPVEECLRWLDEHPEVERRSVLLDRDRPPGHARTLRRGAPAARRSGRSRGGARCGQVPDLPGAASLRSRDAGRGRSPRGGGRSGDVRGSGGDGRARQLHVVLLQPRPGAARARPR